MITLKWCSAVALGGLVSVLAACQDAPTVAAPARTPTAGIAQDNRGFHSGEVPFYCMLGRHAPSTPTGWQTRPDTLFFPKGELGKGGQTVRYEYRRSFADGRPLNAASCVVPYTEEALRRVDRYFGVTAGGGADQYHARQRIVTTQDCEWSGSACVFDPLVAVAPPPSDPPCPSCDAPFPGHTGGGGWGGLGGGGGGGGGDGDNDGGEIPPDPQDTPSDTICKTSDPVINSEVVQAAFEQLWKNSNYEVNGVIQPQSERREQGGFIIATSTGYTFQPFPSDWEYKPCEIIFPQDFRPPPGTVAYAHTHPFTLHEQQIACGEVIPGSGLYQNYPGKSSDGDNKAAGLWDIPGYLLDANQIARFTSDEAAPDVPFGRCAY